MILIVRVIEDLINNTMEKVAIFAHVKIPSLRVVASPFTCWLFYKLLLIGVLSSLTLFLYISSLLVTLDSQWIIIQITATPIILGRIELFILCIHLIILFMFYLLLLDLVTKIQSFLFSLFTSPKSL